MIKQTLTKQIDKLTMLMNRDGIEQVEQYTAKSHLPNVIGLALFLCKRKNRHETAISKAAFSKYYNHSIAQNQLFVKR